MQTWEKLWSSTTCKRATLTNAKWDAELGVNRTYLLAQSPPQDSGRSELAKPLSLEDDVCLWSGAWSTSAPGFLVEKAFPTYHHYKEGIFIRIFQTKKLEFRKLKTMQPRTGKPETGSKVSDASNLLIASWEEPCGCLPSRLGSKFSWTDTGVGGLYLEELSSCGGAAGSKKHWVWGSLFSHPSIQTCRDKGVLEFSLNFKTHFPLSVVKTFGQKLKSGLVIHVFAVGL